MRIGMFGTFDVENYGDLLFPLIAERELMQRLKDVQLIRYSYNEKKESSWVYDVRSLADLEKDPAKIQSFDCILIGGGHLIRFDKGVANQYGPPLPQIPHPTGYWLTPALAGIISGRPVIWNAPSSSDEFPAWAHGVLTFVLSNSAYVSVRDQSSAEALRKAGYNGTSNIVPDTAFAVARHFPRESMRAQVDDLLSSIGLGKKYIVIQAIPNLEQVITTLLSNNDFLSSFDILALPIGPILGDDISHIQSFLPQVKCFPVWPSPKEIAGIVAYSRGVIGVSLHLSITALAYGLPVLRPTAAMSGKYMPLQSSENVYFGAKDDLDGVLAFAEALQSNNHRLCTLVKRAQFQIQEHWDKIAEICRKPQQVSSSLTNSFAQANLFLARQENFGQQVAEKEYSMQVLSAQVAQYEQSTQMLSAQVAQYEQSTQMLSAQVAQKDHTMQALTAQVAQYEQSMQTLSAQVVQKDQTVQALTAQVADKELSVKALTAQMEEKEQSVQALQRQVTRKEQALKGLTTQVVETDQKVQALSAQVAKKNETEHTLSAQVSEKDQALQLLSVQIADRDLQTIALKNQLREITFSKSWRVAIFVHRMGVFLLPPGSWRMRLARKLLPFLHSLFNIRWTYINCREMALIRNSGLFDPVGYLAKNPDVQQSNMDPLLHYVIFGWKEGRNPSQAFDTNYYLEMNPDIKQGQINPLVHYIKYGKNEGRLPIHPKNISSEMHANINLYEPKVTIIVPNYNHSIYLNKRLSSIYSQTYKNIEVILLDDCSNDDSRRILVEYEKKYPEITRCYFNGSNSGSPFSQWEKGIYYSKSDLIWIAESDDFCDSDFLEKLIPFFKDETILLSYAHSIFIDENGEKHDFAFEHYLKEINPHKWDSSYIETSHNEVRSSLGLKNSIPNVSSAVFRRPKENFLLFKDSDWRKMDICGDWLFYLNLLRGGRIAFCRETHSYFRIHQESSSKKTHNKDVFYKEHEKVACAIAALYNVSDELINKNYKIWEDFYFQNVRNGDIDKYSKLFDITKVKQCKKHRDPNILMVTHGFSIGGGEIFPIRLANALKDKGASVTMFNRGYEYNPKVREMLYPQIPIINYEPSMDINALIRDYGIDIIHTHHASMEYLFAVNRENSPSGPKHVATMHGMYEMMDNFKTETKEIIKSVDHWFYLSEKNVVPFKKNGLFYPDKFTKIGNGMKIPMDVKKIDLSSLSITPDSFTACIASRGLQEKGWIEAIEATIKTRKITNKDIHLIILGEGPVYDTLIKQELPSFIHLLGTKENVIEYLASSQLGLLPSCFKGESFPLLLIECFMAEIPIIATNVGEVANMMTVDKNICAGALINLHNGKVDANDLAEAMVKMVLNRDQYNDYVAAARILKDRFNIDLIAQQYLTVYKQILINCNGHGLV